MLEAGVRAGLFCEKGICMLRGLTAAATIVLAASAASADDIAEKAAVCAACHGDNGVPTDKSIPVLWGQNEGYIYIELRDMKKGARKNEQMQAVVETLSRDDMLALAAYFAAKPWPTLPQPRASQADQAHFDSMANSAGCVGCHQAGYKGAGTQPRLAGQAAAYLEKTMLDFRSGARANNSWMTDLLKTYSPGDIAQMARVLAGM
jgi:cytochrome c553